MATRNLRGGAVEGWRRRDGEGREREGLSAVQEEMAPVSAHDGLAFRRPVLSRARTLVTAMDFVNILLCLGLISLFCFFFKKKQRNAEPQIPAAPAPAVPASSGAKNGLPILQRAADGDSVRGPEQNAHAVVDIDGRSLSLSDKMDGYEPLRSQVAAVSVTLDGDYDTRCKEETARKRYMHSLVQPVASDLGVPRECVGVGALQQGSIIVDLLLVQRPKSAPGGNGYGGRSQGNFDTHVLAQELVQKLTDASSSLRTSGLYSRVSHVHYEPVTDIKLVSMLRTCAASLHARLWGVLFSHLRNTQLYHHVDSKPWHSPHRAHLL